ncbi:telomere length regulation protein-domain-containing protein [Boeremia exigua]|uniref:telomere length regulation protein-domain-containing protein n=1 Tax=Boeremia exigua TaxID=749465 RepID=UPI001E8E62BB|nr:telomere length regulation protein-domain-containing protein [Boeremia exigua]KAH6638087.1 telomere length regulation protein-domain-containing protein [Boeremia exigua]
MADFLTAVSTKKINSQPTIQKIQDLSIQDAVTVDSAQTALEALKGQPSHDTFIGVLKFLNGPENSLVVSEPVYTSIAHELVSNTIPNFWRVLKHRSKDSRALSLALRNPTGVGHLLTRLRSLIADSRQKKVTVTTQNVSEFIEDTLDVLEIVLSGDDVSFCVWKEIQNFGKNDIRKKLMWKEYLAQVASGRVLSIRAEAEDILKEKGVERSPSSGSDYAGWLGRNIVHMLANGDKSETLAAALTELSSKILSLGYTDRLIATVLDAAIEQSQVDQFVDLISRMKSFEQRKYLNAIIVYITKQFFQSEMVAKEDIPISQSPTISGAACLLNKVIQDNEILKDHIISSLTRSTIPSLDESLATRRTVVAALAQDEDKLQTMFENCIKTFGDSVYIKHTPILQQEALAQTLALCCGYVQRTQPMFVMMMAKSTYHVNGMSSRIGAASPRARFFGIAVGSAMSRMVDKPELQLKIELEGSEADEAKWYERLTKVDDKIGTMADLQKKQVTTVPLVQSTAKPKPVKKALKNPAITEVQGPRIVEVLSDSEDEDADLIAYSKPDSDPEDEDEDPTALNRNKPTTPVYIRDLVAGLRDQENYDRHELALATAASLIRRKANFGTEVADHIEDLAAILTGLQNGLELESFAQQRQQALIAVLLARPAPMAQWFARSFFSGDYSFAQRIAMLTTLGLGARELAGMKDAATEDLVPVAPSFPSKQLPPQLHKLYTEDKTANPVAKLTSSMARAMLSPLASQAAEELSGPNVLKVRTFSTRMEVEAARKKPIPNALAQIVADNFFFPLTGRWWLQIRSSSDSIYASTHLLPPFLQTLSLLLNASGPNTLSLPQMTREYWDLLLSVRGLASNDKAILSALLFGFLMLLETNENKERLATEQGKELMETQAWVKMVFEGLGAGSEEDERIRVLAAGVVIRCQEVVDKYQRRMAGALMDY